MHSESRRYQHVPHMAPLEHRAHASLRVGSWVLVAVALAVAPRLAASQEQTTAGAATPTRGFWLAPYINSDATYTRSTTGAGTQSNDLLLRVTPGLRFSQRSGRVQASLNYAGNFIARRASGRTEHEFLNSLDATLNAEVVPGWGYFSAQATISQQPISAYGQAIGNGAEANANRTEVSTIRLTPYVEGMVADWGQYRADWNLVGTRSGNILTPNSHSNRLAGALSSRKGGGRLGWSVYGSTLTSNFNGQSRDATTDQVGGEISYTPDVDWRFHIRGGAEYSDVSTADRRRYSNYGAGLQWTPSPRTRLVLEAEERYFGRAHKIAFDHRAVFGSIRYSDGTDVVTGTDAQASGVTQSLRQLYTQQLAALQPDPLQLQQYVENLIRQLGRDPNELVSGAFLMPGITVQRRRELSVTYLNRRLSGALAAFKSRVERIDSAAQSAPMPSEPIQQSGYNATVGWKLTPLSTMSLTYSFQKTVGTSVTGFSDSNNTTLLASFNQQLGRRVYGTVSLRRSAFDFGSTTQHGTGINGLLSLTY
jgi:uncharacterized protein (PEP-CTERM system associated)